MLLRFSDFRRRYNQQIISEYRFLNIRGLRTKGTFPIELEQVFVELYLIAGRHTLQTHFDPIFTQKLTGKRLIWDFLRFGKRHENDTLVLAIVGAPGCGKTTLLQHVALTVAAGKQRRYRFSSPVPILLFLPHHISKIIAEEPDFKSLTLSELLQEHFNDSQKYPYLNLPPQWFEQQLKKGKCLVLLDGLDKIADLKQRQAVSSWIEKQTIDYSSCDFILTARPQGYFMAPVQSAHVLEIQPFNAEQVQQFIEAWYLAHEVSGLGGKIDYGKKQRAKQQTKELLQSLRQMPSWNTLGVNPLRLAMMAIILHRHEQLSDQLTKLYAASCSVLLEHSGIVEGEWEKLTVKQKCLILEPLAAEMMHRQRCYLFTNEAISIITEPLEKIGLSSEVAESFLSNIQANSGLLLERHGVWYFAHLTFQEYLAAAHLLEQPASLDWDNKVNESWWYEVLRWYAMQSEVTVLVQAALNHDNVLALMLATSCLKEIDKLDNTLYDQLVTVVITHLEARDAQRCQLSAEFVLNQRLENLTPLDEQREIDLNYITCAEYQLFLDDLRAQGQYHQPDHWTEYRFTKGTAQAPITGIRVEDAEAFCEWLTQRQGGEVRYRLPLPSEAQMHPVSTKVNPLATWCKTRLGQNEVYGLIWSSKEDEQFINIKLKNFSSLPLSSGYALCYARTLIQALNKARSNVHNSELSRDLAGLLAVIRAFIVRDLDLALDFAFNLNLALSLDRAHIDHSLHSAIDRNDFQAAQQMAQAMQTDPIPVRQQLGKLLDELLAHATATNSMSLRQALRKYAALVAEMIFNHYNELEQQHSQHFWSRRHQSDYHRKKKLILNLHWWLRVVIAREEGQLPAWEGIRLVRERRTL